MRAATALVGALCVLALGACGSPPLSVSQLRMNATRVCQQASTRGNHIPAATSSATAATFLRSAVPVLRDEVADLRGLMPPSSLASTYNSAVEGVSEQLRLLRQTVQRLDSGAEPLSAIRMLQQQLSPSEARTDTSWRSLGIPACATS